MLAALYCLFLTPIGWAHALAVWVYGLAWLPVESVIAMPLFSTPAVGIFIGWLFFVGGTVRTVVPLMIANMSAFAAL